MKKSNTINSYHYDYKTGIVVKSVSFDENGDLMPIITHIKNIKLPYTVQKEGKHIIQFIFEEYKKRKMICYTDNVENKNFLNEIWYQIREKNSWILSWMDDKNIPLIPVSEKETLAYKAKLSKIEKIKNITEMFPDFNPEYDAQIHTIKEYIKEVDQRDVPESHQIEYIKETNGYVLKKVLFKPNGVLKGITYIFGKIKENTNE